MSAVWILGGSIVLALAAASAAYANRATPHRLAFRVAFPLACVLVVVAGYGAWRESRALGELAAIVPPFSGIDRAQWVPSLGDERFWVFHASAPTEAVRRFYAEPQHRGGWTIVRESHEVLVLRKDNVFVTLIMTDDPRTGGSTLTYSLEARRGR